MVIKKNGNSHEITAEPIKAKGKLTGYHEADFLDFGIFVVSRAIESKNPAPTDRLLGIAEKAPLLEISAISRELKLAKNSSEEHIFRLSNPEITLIMSGLTILVSPFRRTILDTARIKSPIDECLDWAVQAENKIAQDMIDKVGSGDFRNLPTIDELIVHTPFGFNKG